MQGAPLGRPLSHLRNRALGLFAALTLGLYDLRGRDAHEQVFVNGVRVKRPALRGAPVRVGMRQKIGDANPEFKYFQ